MITGEESKTEAIEGKEVKFIPLHEWLLS